MIASAPPERIGPYQIIRLLGLGGMAQVYHARKSIEGVDLVVALKVPRQHIVMEPASRASFLKEARITARLGSHPNIVQVLDVGVDGELPYMALEYVTGIDLGRLCEAMRQAGTRWSEPAILWVVASILQGLRHAWGAEVAGQPLGIVHRDISPSNILVTYEGQVKVTDFGISRMAGLPTSGSIRGKARYMPYEQIMGRPTVASDLYAVGAIAWELIEGKPFRYDKQTVDEMYLATMNAETPAITRPDVSPRLVQLVTRLLHHDVAQRIQTPMDAWLELKACPGLNLVDPDSVRVLIEEFLGKHRQSGYTAVQVRIHPELVATRAALAAAVGGSMAPSEERTESVTPPPPVQLEPPQATMKWPYERGNAPPSPQIPGPSLARPRRSVRGIALTGLGLLIGMGLAFGAMKLMQEPVATEARPEVATMASAMDEVPASRKIESAPASGPASLEVPTPTAATAPAVVAVTAVPAPAAVPDPTPPVPEPAIASVPTAPTKPKPKPAPRATLHVRLDLVPELELRIGSKVRRITGSVTLSALASTKELAVRTPGSTTWYPSRVRLEPGREYLVRLHAKRIETIPLDKSSP